MNSGSLKIVAIDDNEDSLLALQAVLVEAFPKVQVFTAWNGREGIELALAEDPDVVLLALGLPEMDGYEACRRLKADDRLSSIPVVLLAARRTDRQSRIKALEEGAHAFLSKSFDKAELIAQVRALARIKVAGKRQKQEAQRLAALVDQQARALERELAERQRLEAVLWQSEECYRGFFDDDLTGNVVSTPEGRILLCNPAFAKIFGFASTREAARTDIRVLYPDAAERMSILQTLRQQGKVERLETWRKRRDGTLIHIIESLIGHFDSRGELCEIRSYIFDDTERQHAEETLRESEEKYRSLFNNAQVGMFCTRLDGSEILDVNEKFLEIFGGTRAEMVGAPSVRHWADPRARQEMVRRLQAEGRVTDFECRMVNQRGEIRTCLTSLRPYHDRGILEGSIQDVTERNQAQKKLQAHRQQLRRLASELSLAEERERRRIALALHDHTCQSLVLARMKLGELQESSSLAQAEVLQGISEGLKDTIEGVRELTFDLSSPTLYKFGLEAALEELLEDKFGAEQDVACDFSDDGAPKPLTEDMRVLLFQSVREVLINIVKHARAHRIGLDIRRAGDSIRIAVTDDGVGFDVDEVSSLPARHRGFGLFSIRERLECIGGALEMNSRRGAGSRFTLVAPLKRESHDFGRKQDVDSDSPCG